MNTSHGTAFSQLSPSFVRCVTFVVLAAAVAAAWCAPASAATFTWIGSGSTANWSVGANWLGGVAPTSTGTHALVWDATSIGNTSSLNDIGGLKISSIAYSNAPGVTLSGSALTMTANPFSTSSSGTITINLDMALAASTTQFADGSDIVINGVLSGGGASMSFNKPFYALYGANTFSGRVVLGTNNGSGIFVVNTLKNSSQNQSLGTGSVIQFGGGNPNDNGRLYYTGGATSTDKVFQIGQDGSNVAATGGVYANGSGALTWTGTQSASTSTTNKTFTLGGFNTGANTWQSAIINNTGTISLTKAGRGTWVLSGSNTFTGAALTVSSGSLVLDYATSASVLTSALAPTLGGSTLEFKARSSGSSAQTLGNFTASTDTGISTVRVNQNGGSGMGVTLGTVTTTAGRSAVLFDLNGSAASSVTIGTAIAPDTGTDGKVLIRTAAGAYDFAVNGGSTATPLSARAATATLSGTNGNAALDYLFTNTGSIGAGSPTTAVSARSLRIAPTLDNQTMTITNTGTYAGGGQAGVVVAGGGLLYDGGSRNFTIAASGTNPNGVAIRTGNNATGFVLSHMGTGTLTIGERVYLGFAGSAPGAGSTMPLGLFGTGLVDWRGGVNANTTGQVLIQGATVRISGTVDPVLLDSTGSGKGGMNILLNAGGVLEAVNGNITRNLGTGTGAIQWKGDGGFSAFGGNRTVSLAGGAAATWGSNSFVPSDNALLLASQYSDSLIDFQNPLALGGLQRVVQVANGSATVDARLSGVLSSGLTGGLVKAGAGTLELTGANTYTGETWVQAGSLRINGNQSAATGAVIVSSGATLGGSGTTGGATTIKSGGILAPGNSPGTLTIANALVLEAGSVTQYEINGTDNTVGGGINDLTRVATSLTLGGTLNVLASPALDLFGSRTWRVFDYATSGTGSLAGSMAVGTTPDANYLYSLNTATAGQVNLFVQRRAEQAAALAYTQPTSGTVNAFTSTNVSFSGTLSNLSPSGGAALVVSLAGNGGQLAVGSLSASSGATVAAGASATVTGQIATGATLGTRTWSVVNTDTTAIGSTTSSASGTVNVFAHGSPTLSGTMLNFGYVLVGTSTSRSATVSNGILGSPTGNTAGITWTAGSLPGGFTGGGANSAGVVASGSGSTYSFTLQTGSARAATGSQTFSFADDTSILGNGSLGSQAVSLSGTVLNPASPSFTTPSSTASWLVDVGSFNQNTGSHTAGFNIYNLFSGDQSLTADLRLDSITPIGTPFGSLSIDLTPALFGDLQAGGTSSWLATLTSLTTGSFTNQYQLNFVSAKGGQDLGGPQSATLTLMGIIVVPEPATMALGLLGIGGIALAAGRRRRRRPA